VSAKMANYVADALNYQMVESEFCGEMPVSERVSLELSESPKPVAFEEFDAVLNEVGYGAHLSLDRSDDVPIAWICHITETGAETYARIKMRIYGPRLKLYASDERAAELSPERVDGLLSAVERVFEADVRLPTVVGL